jgi:hypothetical protein
MRCTPVRQDLPQVLHLIRRAAGQVGAARVQHDLAVFGQRHRRLSRATAKIVDGQLQRLGVDGFLGALVQQLEQGQRALGIALGAVDLERPLAPRDRHWQHGLDRAQMLVQGAAQVRQPRVVERGEGMAEDQAGPCVAVTKAGDFGANDNPPP